MSDSTEITVQQANIPDVSTMQAIIRAEIDIQVSTAHAYPRNLARVKKAAMDLVLLDEESAQECIYALPRGGKPIRGPSIRFAECLQQAYGNCRVGSRVVNVDKAEGFVEAEGIFHDLETNTATTSRVRRRITGRNGQTFNDDMILVTGNAAAAIARRNAILGGVPKPLWRSAYQQAEKALAGDIKTLAERRVKAFKAFAAFGIKPEQIYEALGIEGEEDIGTDETVTLQGMWNALKSGEETVESILGNNAKAKKTAPKLPSDAKKEEQKTAPEVVSSKNAHTTQQGQIAKNVNSSEATVRNNQTVQATHAKNAQVQSGAPDKQPEPAQMKAYGEKMIKLLSDKGCNVDMLKAALDDFYPQAVPDKANQILNYGFKCLDGEAGYDFAQTKKLIETVAG